MTDTSDDAVESWAYLLDANRLRGPAATLRALLAERDRLRNLLSLAEAKLSDGRLYIGYGDVGPLHDSATASIIRSARTALAEGRA